MAQQQLCRVGTHEEERRSDPPQNGGKTASWYTEIVQHFVPNLVAGNAAASIRPVSGDKTCPPRLQPLLPPKNFGAVMASEVYRSSMPEPENFGFLATLKLKMILTLVSECKPEYDAWIKEQGIKHVREPVPANKDVIQIEPETVLRALTVVLDCSNYPLLIHCNKGKHRTGCIVGCLRKVQGESMAEVINEYHAYADPKARRLDENFIRDFDERSLLPFDQNNSYLPVDEPSLEPSTLMTRLPVSRLRY